MSAARDIRGNISVHLAVGTIINNHYCRFCYFVNLSDMVQDKVKSVSHMKQPAQKIHSEARYRQGQSHRATHDKLIRKHKIVASNARSVLHKCLFVLNSYLHFICIFFLYTVQPGWIFGLRGLNFSVSAHSRKVDGQRILRNVGLAKFGFRVGNWLRCCRPGWPGPVCIPYSGRASVMFGIVSRYHLTVVFHL